MTETHLLTDAELQGIALQALNMAKRDLLQHKFNFLVGAYHHGEGLHRMRKIETLLIETLGEDWLNGGRTKDAGFGVLRSAVERMPPDAVVFVSIVNQFMAAEKLRTLGEEEARELLNSTHDRHHRAVAEGLLTVHDALYAIAQDPRRICMYVQMIDRHLGFLGPPDIQFMDQDNFSGRMKMYGPKSGYTDAVRPARKAAQ